MPSQDRRAAARRRAWGRGPIILRFDSLENRQLLAATPLPDLVGDSFATTATSASWGDPIEVVGKVLNQGQATVSQSFQVAIVASTSPVIGPGSVTLGQVTVQGGIAPGQTGSYDQTFELPATPLAKFAGKPIYIAAWIDPSGTVAESNKGNNFAVGNGYDESLLNIVTHQPSDLIGTSLGVTNGTVEWGQQVTVAAQVRNNASGDAPATRAAVILTPSGTAPGSGSDVTIGYINVPAVPAWQTVNVSQTFTLPTTVPNALAGNTAFTLSLIQDADYTIDPMYPHGPTQGTGKDSVPITINANPNINTTNSAEPDLAAGTLQAPTTALPWGGDFQVTGSVQNIGAANSGSFQVSFLLTGANGALSPAIYLGGTTIDGLAAGGNQSITQTLHLPGRLPNGVNINGNSTGRIAMVVDPQDVINETIKTNNVSESNPVTLRLLGTDGSTTVPTYPPSSNGVTLGTAKPAGTVNTTPSGTPIITTKAQQHAAAVQSQLQAARQAKIQAHQESLHSRRSQRKVYPKVTKENLTTKIEHKLKVFPNKVSSFFNNLFH